MLHSLILKMRHRAYDTGRKASESSPVPSICIGNVTVGGTGKTPHTEMILRMLSQSRPGLSLAVLSRGYKRQSKGYLDVVPGGDAKDFGDEPLQIAGKFPDVKVAVDEDRVEGCRKLAEAGAGLILLDDAFQHRRIKADLNIVLVNWKRPVFEDKLLPFGKLRDLPERIFAADIIIVSKAPGYLDDAERAAYATRLRLKDYNPESHSATTPDGKRVLLLFTTLNYLATQAALPEGDRRYIYSNRAFAISGIANNRSFISHISTKYRITKAFSYADHHYFTKKDLERITRYIDEHPYLGIATTEKDRERLRSCPYTTNSLRERLFIVPIETAFLSEEEKRLFLLRIESVCQSGVKSDDLFGHSF